MCDPDHCLVAHDAAQAVLKDVHRSVLVDGTAGERSG